MVIALDAKLESLLKSRAESAGVTPEELALNLLRERLRSNLPEPRDEWERELLASIRPWPFVLSDRDASSEGFYE